MRKKTFNREYIQIGCVTALAVTAFILCIYIFSPSLRYRYEMREGAKYLKEMDYDRAALSFTNAININNQEADPHIGLGYSYAGMGDRLAFGSGENQDRESGSSRGTSGNTDAGDFYKEAIDQMRNAEQIDSEDADIPIGTATIYVNKAAYEEQTNDHDAALADAEAARKEVGALLNDGTAALTESQTAAVDAVNEAVTEVQGAVQNAQLSDSSEEDETEDSGTESVETEENEPEPIPDGALEGMHDVFLGVVEVELNEDNSRIFDPETNSDQFWNTLYYLLSMGRVYNPSGPNEVAREEVEEAAGSLTANPDQLPDIPSDVSSKFGDFTWNSEGTSLGPISGGDGSEDVQIVNTFPNRDGTVTCTVDCYSTEEEYDYGHYTFLLAKNEYYDENATFRFYYKVVKAAYGDEAPAVDSEEEVKRDAVGLTNNDYRTIYAGAFQDAHERIESEYPSVDFDADSRRYLLYDITGDGYKELFYLHYQYEADRGYYVYTNDGRDYSFLTNFLTFHGSISGIYQDGISVTNGTDVFYESYYKWNGTDLAYVSDIGGLYSSGEITDETFLRSLGITPLISYRLS